jgi:hypothetical protein
MHAHFIIFYFFGLGPAQPIGADQRVACSVVGSSSSLRIFLMFFSFYSIEEAAAVTLEAGRLQAAVAAIFFFFPV